MNINEWIREMRNISTDFNYNYTEEDFKKVREALQMFHDVDYLEMKDEHKDEFVKMSLDYFNIGKDFSYIEEISTKVGWHFKSKYDCQYSCTYCGKELKKVSGEEIYGISKYPGWYWKCENCIDTHVGCHKGTEIPLGTVANKELRILRNELHSEFDILWKSGIMTRKQAYNWLSQKMGIKYRDTHIAMFNKEQCEKALNIMKNAQ